MSGQRAVTLIGVGADGCRSLSSRAIGAVSKSQVLVGGKRHLAFFPEFGGQRIVLEGKLTAVLSQVSELCEDNTVSILASGDPLFFGVGSLVVRRIGAEHVDILPQPSSIQLAFARIGQKWDDAQLISVHGRPLAGLAVRLRGCNKAALLTDSKNSPAVIARHLLEYGQAEFLAWVCENLGGPDERVRSFTLEQLSELGEVAALNVLLLTRTVAAGQGQEPCAPRVIPFFSEDAFSKRVPKKGLITKQEVRLLSLAQLELRRDSVVWDVGAGSGSVAIEAALLAPDGHSYAVEVNEESVEHCIENAKTHGADNLTVISGKAPEALNGLAPPDAVFIGGSKGNMSDIVRVVAEHLRPGGKLVINTVTLESVAEAHAALKAEKFEVNVTLLQLSRSKPLAHYLRFEALNPVHIFSARKPLGAST